jgi:hypothetical protein
MVEDRDHQAGLVWIASASKRRRKFLAVMDRLGVGCKAHFQAVDSVLGV